MLPVLALGVSPFIMQSTESLLSITLNASLKYYGTDTEVGAMPIISSVSQFIMLPLMGFSQGSQPITSFNYGAGNYERVRGTFRMLLTCCVSYSVLAWLTVMLFPEALARVFNSDPALLSTRCGPAHLPLRWCSSMAQNACSKPFWRWARRKFRCPCDLRKMLLFIPLILILPGVFGLGVFGIFLASPLTDIVAVSTTLTLFMLRSKKLLHPTPETQRQG
jgi:Na+-driven multidrug efflux pump